MRSKNKSSKMYRIRKEGGSNVVTIGSYIPDDWYAVKIIKKSETKETVTLCFERIQ